MILPLGAALQQRVEATSCNRDIFTILQSGQCSFQIQPLTHTPLPLPENHNQAISSFFETASLKSTDLKVDLRESRWTARWHGKNGHQHDQRRRRAVATSSFCCPGMRQARWAAANPIASRKRLQATLSLRGAMRSFSRSLRRRSTLTRHSVSRQRASRRRYSPRSMLRRHFIGLRRTLHSAPAPAWQPSEPNSARSSTAPSADSRHWAGVLGWRCAIGRPADTPGRTPSPTLSCPIRSSSMDANSGEPWSAVNSGTRAYARASLKCRVRW